MNDSDESGRTLPLDNTDATRITTKRRVNVNFAASTYTALEELARKRGKSMAEILRDAIALEKWIEEVREEGGRLLVRQDNETRELLLR